MFTNLSRALRLAPKLEHVDDETFDRAVALATRATSLDDDTFRRAVAVAPAVRTLSDDQFRILHNLAAQVDEVNRDRVPVFVFSEETRLLVKAIGIRTEVIVVSASEAHLVAELVSTEDVTRAQAIFNELNR